MGVDKYGMYEVYMLKMGERMLSRCSVSKCSVRLVSFNVVCCVFEYGVGDVCL